MSFCVNPDCPNPQNPLKAQVCAACGQSLLLNKRYKPLRSLGKGGFAATFLAVDLNLPGTPPCVVKQLRPSRNVTHLFEMARELFRREAQTLGRIGNHPQIPRLLDYFEDGPQFYLVQEYVKGHNLRQEVKSQGVFGQHRLGVFLQEVLPVLDYVHSQKVIHRDIKPANIIRRAQDNKLVLIDFGAVKNDINFESLSHETDDSTTLTSFAVGTPGYAPPEQMAMRPVFASDIYSLGITCLYLLTGKSPKNLGYDPQTGDMNWEEYVDISDSLASVIRKMLESAVKYRFQSANEVLDALEFAAQNEHLFQETSDLNDASGNNHTSVSGSLSGSLGMGRSHSDSFSSGSNVQNTYSRNFSVSPRDALNLDIEGENKSSLRRNAVSSETQNIGRSPRNVSFARETKVSLTAKDILRIHREGHKDFAHLKLIKLNVPNANLSGCIFHQSQLINANLQGAILSSVDFGKASLLQANLRNAILDNAYFSYANLSKADLRGANLSSAYLLNANLESANLCGANLQNAKVTREQLKQAKTNWSTVYPNGKRSFFK